MPFRIRSSTSARFNFMENMEQKCNATFRFHSQFSALFRYIFSFMSHLIAYSHKTLSVCVCVSMRSVHTG